MKIKFNEPVKVAPQEFIIVKGKTVKDVYHVERRISSADGFCVHWKYETLTKFELREVLGLKKNQKLEVVMDDK